MKINKGKKKIFAAALILLFFTVLSASILNTNPAMFLGFPTNNNYIQIQPAKSYTGNGIQLSSLLYITNNTNSTASASNTDDNLYIPCPNGWKIVWTNLTLSNINAPNVTIEPNASSPDDSLSLGFYVMSFQLANDAYLDFASVQLTVDTEGTANFYVYNATDNGSGVPKPQNSIKTNSSVSLSMGTNYWEDIYFEHVFLNTSNTYDKTFFIAVEKTGTLLVGRWRAITDNPSPGAGRVYYYTGSDWSSEQAYDCKLKVNVSASTAPAESAKPSEIGLTINGSQVSDISKGNGAWINSTASSVSTGYIFYDVNSTWMSTVSFSYIWNITCAKDTYITATTNFDVSNNSNASWNITVDATDAFPPTNGVNHINITGIPSDWGNESSKAYNSSQWIALDSFPPNTVSFIASNGTWTVNCTAPNYVSSIGFEVGGVTVENATLYDNLNITVNFTTSVTGTVNLSIYDPFQILNHTEEKSITATTSSYFIWNVSNNATSTGTYNATIRFKDGLAVGYNETTLLIVPLTNTYLNVTSYPTSVEYPGPVPITLYYNDTDNNRGVAGATITAYFSNSTPATIQGTVNNQGNGFYSLNLTFGTDFGVHDVYFNAGGLRLFAPSNSSTISIDYTRKSVSITIGFQVGGVPVANATLYDDNLNITVNFGYSVSGNVTLNIYDPSQVLNHTAENPVASATSTWFIWDVSDNATLTGPYNVTISLDGALAVGYNEKNLSIVPLTNTYLNVTSYPTSVEYPGPVPITLYYNDTDNNRGVAGATITAYEDSTNLTLYGFINHGNGSYSFNLNFTTDFRVHNVTFNASGVRLFESSVSIPVLVSYTQLFVSIELDTPTSVVLGTSLVASVHLQYTNSSSPVVGELVNFNFSIRFSNGSSTVNLFNYSTNTQGLASYSILVPMDTVELNVTAFYNGTSTVSGATSSTNSVTLTSGGVSPSDTGLVALMFLMMTQQNRNFVLYLLLAVVVGVVALVVVAANRVRMSHEVPLKAMASLENIIVDHIPTGSTLWAFDFFKMEQDATLVSGFMSAVKSFMGEMQKGGLRKLETEFGTFIREDGALLTATCITCGNTSSEENWIRQRLRSFLSIAEQQHLDALQKWSGDVAAFRKSFPKILASVIDLDKTEELHRQRVLKLESDKERLQAELNNLGSELESLNQQFEAKEISKAEFEAREARIEPQYDKVQKEYIHVSLCLSRVPPKLEVTEDVEKIQESFLKIRMEIEELRRKEQEGTITSKDLKRRDKLQKELMALIEKLDKLKK